MTLPRALPVAAAFVLAAPVARGGPPGPVEAPRAGHFEEAVARQEAEAEEREMARAEFLEAAEANTEIVVAGLPPAAGACAGRAAERATRAVAGRIRETMTRQNGLYAVLLDTPELRAQAKQLRQLVRLARVADRVRERRQALERPQAGDGVRMLLAARSEEPATGAVGDAPPAVGSTGEETAVPPPAREEAETVPASKLASEIGDAGGD